MKIVSPPTVEPVTLDQARRQCNIDPDYEGSPPTATSYHDPMLEIYISAAREWVEKYLGCAIAPQTVEVAADAFPTGGSYFTFAYAPLLGVESIRYVEDVTGDNVELDASLYTLNTDAYPARLLLNPAQVWPSAKATPSSVKIRYVVGFSTPGTSPQDAPLPASIRAAVLLLVAHLFKNREATSMVAFQNIPYGVRALLAPYKLQFPIA